VICRIVTVLLLIGACGSPKAPVRDERVEAWRADLRFLGRELPARHHDAFFALPEADFRAGLAALDTDLATLDDDQVIARLAQLVARLGDGHTRIVAPLVEPMPLRLFWFDDGLYLLAAPAAEAWAVGGEIVAIGGVPTPDALATLTSVVSHDNPSQARGEAPAALLRPELVRGLGLAGANGSLALTIRPRAGRETRELFLQPSATPPSWHLGAGAPARLPLARRGPRQPYWSHYLPDARALFVQYSECRDAQPSFAAFVDELAATLASQPVDRLVIDLRTNGGGNSAVFAPMLALIRAHPRLKIFALIGRGTFSSAVLNALELEALGATLVGEVAGGAPSHHGEVRSFTLPSHPLTVSYSTRRFTNARHPGAELAPSLPVAVTAADFFAGQDAAVDAALAAP